MRGINQFFPSILNHDLFPQNLIELILAIEYRNQLSQKTNKNLFITENIKESFRVTSVGFLIH